MADYYQPSTTTGTGPTDQDDQTASPTQGQDNSQNVAPGTPLAQDSPPAPAEDAAPETTPAEGPAIEQAPEATEPAQTTTAPAGNTESYDALVDKLIGQLGFDNVSEPQKSELIDAIKERIETRVLRVLMTSLTEEQNKNLEEKVKAENLDEKAIIEFISREAPNASAMIVSALDDLYMEMKQEVDTLTRAAGAQVADKQQQ